MHPQLPCEALLLPLLLILHEALRFLSTTPRPTCNKSSLTWATGELRDPQIRPEALRAGKMNAAPQGHVNGPETNPTSFVRPAFYCETENTTGGAPSQCCFAASVFARPPYKGNRVQQT